MTRRVTRSQAQTWLHPMRQTLQGMTSGYAPATDGYAVTRLHEGDDWVRTDQCIAGFLGLIRRLFPDQPTPSLEHIQHQLAAQRLITRAQIEAAMRELRDTEHRLTRITVPALQSAVRTEQIAIELEALGAAA